MITALILAGAIVAILFVTAGVFAIALAMAESDPLLDEQRRGE